MNSRVFCIGLSRTGTTSLHAAAVMLGFSAIHYPIGLASRWIAGDLSEESLGRFEFFSDLPMAAYYRDFDRSCPNSKFILTVRDPEPWLDSVERLFRSRPPSSDCTVQRDALRLACYGLSAFQRQHFLDVYHRHLDEVSAYFSSRPSDLLTLDISKETDPWGALHQFVERDIPTSQFPHLRKSALGSLKFVLPEEIIEKRHQMIRLVEKRMKKATS